MKVSNINRKFLNTLLEKEYDVVVEFYIFYDECVANAGLDNEYHVPYLRVDIVSINKIPLGSVVEFDKDEIESIKVNIEDYVNSDEI